MVDTSVMAPLLSVPAAVLVAAGAGKLRAPDDAAAAIRSAGLPAGTALARVAGAVEIGIGGAVMASPSRPALLALAAVYALLAGFAVRLMRAGEAVTSCGCFGADGPPTRLHAWFDAVAAATAVVASLAPPPGLAHIAAAAPLAGAGLVAGCVASAYAVTLVLRHLPAAATAYRPERASR